MNHFESGTAGIARWVQWKSLGSILSSKSSTIVPPNGI